MLDTIGHLSQPGASGLGIAPQRCAAKRVGVRTLDRAHKCEHASGEHAGGSNHPAERTVRGQRRDQLGGSHWTRSADGDGEPEKKGVWRRCGAANEPRISRSGGLTWWGRAAARSDLCRHASPHEPAGAPTS